MTSTDTTRLAAQAAIKPEQLRLPMVPTLADITDLLHLLATADSEQLAAAHTGPADALMGADAKALVEIRVALVTAAAKLRCNLSEQTRSAPLDQLDANVLTYCTVGCRGCGQVPVGEWTDTYPWHDEDCRRDDPSYRADCLAGDGE